jgi:aldose 1-epimerase
MKVFKKFVLKHREEDIYLYKIENNNGISVSILNYGGIVTEILTPDKNGMYENIVVGFKDIKDYIKNPSYFGSIIGRTAGRIYKGEFNLNKNTYNLAKNYTPNQGHGGNIGFDKKIWDANIIEYKDKVSLVLKTSSNHMEEGYPGNLDVEVIYTLDNDNNLNITYMAISDNDTLVNMTNHSYFNLSGNLKRPITNQYLKINSDCILEIDDTGVPTGKKLDVSNTPFDFRNIKCIGDGIDSEHNQIKLGYGYDHPFVLKNNNQSEIYLKDSESKRYMEISTNQSCVVVYSMNFTNCEFLYNNDESKTRFGICFETQQPPIGYDQVFLENSILKKGKKYKQITNYKFGLLK